MMHNDIFQLIHKNYIITFDKSTVNTINISALDKRYNKIYSTFIDKSKKENEYDMIEKGLTNIKHNFYDIYEYHEKIDLIFVYLIGDTQVKIYINLNELSYFDLIRENQRLMNKLIKNVNETNEKVDYMHGILNDMKRIIKNVEDI